MSMLARRRFLADSLFSTAAISAGSFPKAMGEETTATSVTSSNSPPRNGRLAVAVVGTGSRGSAHARFFTAHADCDVVALCDADLRRAGGVADQTEKAQGKRPKVYQDLRRIMDDRSIDCVAIAACNHWHALAAIWAMRAGKDVYVEKPLSWSVEEGRRVIEAARKYDRICQVGTQYRSDETIRNAKQFLDEGGIGRITAARSLTYKRRTSIGPVVDGKVPDSVDYNLWAGPAPTSPITRKQFHYDWHWFWETGNGDLGNSDVHRADLCCWAINQHDLGGAVMSFGGRLGYTDSADTPNTLVVVHDLGDKTFIQEVRGLPSDGFAIPGGAAIYGTEGIVSLSAGKSTLYDPDGKKIRRFDGPAADAQSLSAVHIANFVDAVRSRRREDLHAEVAQGHVSAGMCHLGNISYRLGETASPERVAAQLESRRQSGDLLAGDLPDTLLRTVDHLKANGVDLAKDHLTLGPWLKFVGNEERFVDNESADTMLTRPYRKPFVVPSADEV